MAPVKMQSLPETVTPPEIPDGIVTDFTTPSNYVPGTVSVYLNGQRKLASLDDGFIEIAPATVRMKEPPLTGDTIAIQFEPE